MSILEYLNTPADLYSMALECGAAWDEGYSDARGNIARAEELKAAARQGQPTRAMQPRMPRKLS